MIPLYNHEKYIEAAIESVLAQTVRPAELIIIDDGSSDGSAETVRNLCAQHPEIIFWSWPNQGAHHSINAAILRATGDFVAILNSDDCFDRERLAACLAIAESDPSVDVVATEISFIDEQGRSVENAWYDDALAFYKREGNIALALFHANFLVTTSNLFIRRAVIERVGYFSPMRYTHDLEFSLRLVSAQRKMAFLNRRLLTYRLHGENTIAENRARVRVEQAAVYACHLFRQRLARKVNPTSCAGLDRYVEGLRKQELLEMVDHFLQILEARPAGDTLSFDSLPADFLRFLSRHGTEWVVPGAGDPSLELVMAARHGILGQQERASPTPAVAAEVTAHADRLAAHRDEWENAKELEERKRVNRVLEELRQSNSWLASQRDAWEKTAKEHEEHVTKLSQALDDLRAGTSWLAGERDAWEKKVRDQEEHARELNQALEEMRAGNVWLAGERDAWERKVRDQEEHARELNQALLDMRTGNAWMTEQRDAWEKVAREQGERIAELNRALEDMSTGNAWLAGQRDAWEKVAGEQGAHAANLRQALDELSAGSSQLVSQREVWEKAARMAGEALKLKEHELAVLDAEIGKCHSAVRELLRNRLFRVLLRARLLKLENVPSDTDASQ